MARNVRLDDPIFNEELSKSGSNIFNNEDKPMIEAQQRSMGEINDLLSLRPVLLASNVPSVRVRRIILQLLEGESSTLRAAS